jgi:light-regulated signal transduction histidine kinase (bacteriophytochrome)
MWHNPTKQYPVPLFTDGPPEENPLLQGIQPEKGLPQDKTDSPLQRLMLESGAEELDLRLKEPLRPGRTDLVGMVSKGVTVLSNMAAELGVVLRVKVRGQRISSAVDEEKIRRVINALTIHLLTVSQSDGWVTIGLEDGLRRGRRGFVIRLTAGRVVLPLKTTPEYEEELDSRTELSLCRQIVEKHGGELSVHIQDDNKLTYSVWLPA